VGEALTIGAVRRPRQRWLDRFPVLVVAPGTRVDVGPGAEVLVVLGEEPLDGPLQAFLQCSIIDLM